jgi:sedoheptulose-bisphosphatase
MQEIREKYHKDAIKKESEPCDVLVVAHGHILRAFAARFIGKDIAHNPSLILEAGGVGTLRFVQSTVYSVSSHLTITVMSTITSMNQQSFSGRLLLFQILRLDGAQNGYFCSTYFSLIAG